MPFDKDMLEMEEKIYLGGLISQKYKLFQKIARLTPEYAEILFILENAEKWESMTEEKAINELMEYLGQCEFVRQCTELSKLSMVMGDSRKRFSMKAEIDELRKSQADPSA